MRPNQQVSESRHEEKQCGMVRHVKLTGVAKSGQPGERSASKALQRKWGEYKINGKGLKNGKNLFLHAEREKSW